MCEKITELDKQSLEYHFSRLKKEEFGIIVLMCANDNLYGVRCALINEYKH